MNDSIKEKVKQLIANKARFPKSLDTILYMVESILENPYSDYARIIDKKLYHSRLFNSEIAVEILKELSFEEDPSCLYYSYDKDVTCLKLFKDHIEKAILETVISSSENICYRS